MNLTRTPRITLAALVIGAAFAAQAADPVPTDAAPVATVPTVTAPAVVPAQAPAVAPAETRPEGRHLHGKGVNLSPGVAELAKREGEVDLQKDERVKCEKYKPLGSNRWQYRCTTLTEDQLAREKNNHEMRKFQTPPPAAHGTLGR